MGHLIAAYPTDHGDTPDSKRGNGLQIFQLLPVKLPKIPTEGVA